MTFQDLLTMKDTEDLEIEYEHAEGEIRAGVVGNEASRAGTGRRGPGVDLKGEVMEADGATIGPE